jgi:hypothetical protein
MDYANFHPPLRQAYLSWADSLWLQNGDRLSGSNSSQSQIVASVEVASGHFVFYCAEERQCSHSELNSMGVLKVIYDSQNS